jgi:hypothetical protein
MRKTCGRAVGSMWSGLWSQRLVSPVSRRVAGAVVGKLRSYTRFCTQSTRSLYAGRFSVFNLFLVAFPRFPQDLLLTTAR